MKDSLKTKIGIILFSLSIVSAFLLNSRLSEESNYTQPEDLPESKKLQLTNKSPNVEAENQQRIMSGTTLEAAPTAKQQGKAKGENSVIKFEKDLETALKIQETPKIYLEYTDENNIIVAAALSPKVQSLIEKRFHNTLEYSYQNQIAGSREAKTRVYENYLNDAAVFATKIDDFEIATPQGKRKISRKEAFAIMHLTAELAIQRYTELRRMAMQLESRKSGA